MMKEPVLAPASPPFSTSVDARVVAAGGSAFPLFSSFQFTERDEAREQMEAIEVWVE